MFANYYCMKMERYETVFNLTQYDNYTRKSFVIHFRKEEKKWIAQNY